MKRPDVPVETLWAILDRTWYMDWASTEDDGSWLWEPTSFNPSLDPEPMNDEEIRAVKFLDGIEE